MRGSPPEESTGLNRLAKVSFATADASRLFLFDSGLVQQVGWMEVFYNRFT
jgi:hypothetical protein